ncbi:hypothetical protein IM543_10010 [Massilia sp. UMI-21]|nr:hypothetical protein IM543_10010 [Massilia sp. UMI-21]
MDFQLTIQLLLEDDGLLTIEGHAASWGFAGSTQVYTSYRALEQWAGALEGLALVAGQAVGFEAGGRDSYAYLGVTVSVLDATGHCVCSVAIESNEKHSFESWNKLALDFRTEPSALDRFVRELKTLIRARQGTARLPGTDHRPAG